tara:strand:+ start:21548 stop:22267 length:720 start_codon:yes stop_codon:yes gene_type:complete
MSAERGGQVRRRRCYLVRHGHVDYFDAWGKPLDPRAVPLSPSGVEQAQALANVLRGIRFDRMVCSDYPRARQTLELLAMGQGAATVLPELREIRAGRLRELAPDGLREQVIEAYRLAHWEGACFLGGERWDEFQTRVLKQFFELLREPHWESALLVSHDAVNRVLLGWAAGLGLGGLSVFEQDHACLNVLDIDCRGDQVLGAVIRTLNYTPYNPHKVGVHATVLENLFSAIRPDALTSC